jgi:para-nitrobenzyl esterase
MTEMAGMSRRRFVRQAMLAGCALISGGTLFGQGGVVELEVELLTPLGRLAGVRSGAVRLFRGVPFAEAPVGSGRFRAPVTKQAWTGVRDATQFAAAAVQPGERGFAQSEDCLYLNVWTPDGAPKGLPVFVWIHGGGFTGGASFEPLYDGAEFARRGMVVVTVAYRLGVLGFMDLEPLLGAEYAGSANNAMRDLMMALDWVQRNIESFGGDSARVTIGGESAGAKLTDLLMGVPSAEKLFSGMISESGGAERIWPKSNAQSVGEGFGKQWRDGGAGRTLADLRTAPARLLMETQVAFYETWPQHFPLRCELDGALFPALPIKTIAAGSAKGKRLLIGTNRDESAAFLGAHPSHDPGASDLGNMSAESFSKVYARYGLIYPEMAVEQRRVRAATAEEYWVPSIRVADAAANSGVQVWMYELEFARSGGMSKGEAFHGEELALVWDKPNTEYGSAAEEAALAGQVHGAWAAFLQGEAPCAVGLPAWPEYHAETRSTMMLDVASRVMNAPQEAELELWREL